MDGFKLEGGGGELFKEGFRKLLSHEWNSLKKQIQFAKIESKNNSTRKTIGCLY